MSRQLTFIIACGDENLRSEAMKTRYPDATRRRIRLIFRRQIYVMALTWIIYLISTNYIFKFVEELKAATTHFVQTDAAEAAKNGTLKALAEKNFG